MCIELMLNNIPFTCQKVYSVLYKNTIVGKYISDIVVDNKIILELKSISAINRNIEAQILNYMRVSHLRVGYIINFRNACLEYKRFIL